MNFENVTDSACSRVSGNYMVFEDLVTISEQLLNRNLLESAAVCAQIAASHAFVNHCGFFRSLRLEEILLSIGRKTVEITALQGGKNRAKKEPEHVLHVLNSVRPTGGDCRYVWRWIQQDTSRRHSAALTRQGATVVPQVMLDAVAHAGGSIHQLDKETKNLIAQAQELRRVADSADLIVLHLFADDTVPVIAFADKNGLPPVIFVNHSDHTFWLGVSIINAVAQLRDCSIPLLEGRRGIPGERTYFLPIPLGERKRKLSQEQAKKRLGYSSDTLILVTIATAFKYEALTDLSFLEVITPVIEKHKNTVLLAIGPDDSAMWQAGFSATGGRIIALGRRSDTCTFYEAADVYVDSYPFSSITSMLEAGSCGLPVVTYCPYRGDAQILCSGAPGLTGVMLRAADHRSYMEKLTRLIENKEYRLSTGAATRENIFDNHCGDGWKKYLHELYSKAFEDAGTAFTPLNIEERRIEEVDILLARLYKIPSRLGESIDQYAYHLPYTQRLRLLLKLIKLCRSFSFSMFLPRRLGKIVSRYVAGWRKLPGVSGWEKRRGVATWAENRI